MGRNKPPRAVAAASKAAARAATGGGRGKGGGGAPVAAAAPGRRGRREAEAARVDALEVEIGKLRAERSRWSDLAAQAAKELLYAAARGKRLGDSLGNTMGLERMADELTAAFIDAAGGSSAAAEG